MDPKVSIIILNWNGWKDTIECLESLYQITYPNYDVIVVDNDSEDESIKKIKEYCEGKIVVKSKLFKYNSSNKPIKIIEYTREESEGNKATKKKIKGLSSNKKLILIRNEKNYGFTEGNNIGIRHALNVLNPNYVFLLNNDTVVKKDSLNPLVATMRENQNIGIAGGTLYYYEKKNLIQNTGDYINRYTGNVHTKGDGEIDIGQFNSLRDVDFICGAAMIIRREVFKNIGFLYNDFFFLCEDTDFCLRAKKFGYKVKYIPRSKIYHKGSKSAKKIKKNFIFYAIRNKIWLIFRNGSSSEKMIFSYYHIFYILPKMIVWSVVNNRIDFISVILKGTFSGFFKQSQ